MKSNARIFLILAIFFVVAAALYTVWSVIDPVHAAKQWYEGVEWVGTMGLALSAVLSALIAFYLNLVYKNQGGELAEDRLDAEIDDGDAEQGFFSPWSWWPIMMALSGSLVFAGLAVGVWIAIIGGALLVVSLIGWQYEYYRGHFAR